MKIRMNILTLSLALVAVLGLAGMANAQGYMMGGPGMMNGVAPEKQAAVQKAYDDFATATDQLNQQLIGKQSELNALYNSGSADSGRVQTLTREIGDLNAKLYATQANLRKQLAKTGATSPRMASGNGMGYGMGMRGMHMGGMGMGGMGMGYNGWGCW
jgi:zinc resistance-associated protein